jgi:RecB family exonuclease
LLEPYLAAGSAEWPDPGWHAASYGGRATIEQGIPDPPPPVVAGEEIRGGASTVQRQLDEPLSAFACGRLGIRELKQIETGLSPSVRGSLIHRALDRLYLELPTSEALRSWSAGERRARIDAAVASALRRPLRHADGVLRRLLALERRRLQVMLASFLEAESRRQPFSVVGVETTLGYASSGVLLELRVDRMDRLADGSLLIIDYKTGATKSLLDRHGELLEVQLVVYACAVGGDIGGLALVNVDSRGISYKGTGGSVEWGGLAPEAWDRQLQGWKSSVHRAMAEIAAGDVRIDLTPSANRRRTLDVLSRIEELKRAP